jgi:hypothetical protein
MRMNFPKSLASIVVTVAAAIGLSGCLKVDMDMKITKDEKMNGSMVVGVSEGLLKMMGQKPEDFIKSMQKDDSNIKNLPKGASATQTPYHKDGWVGMTVNYKNMPISELSKTASGAAGGLASASGSTSKGNDFSLTKVGDTYVFSAGMDMSSDSKSGSSAGSDPQMAKMMEQFKPDMRIKFTFPGKVLSANGKISGNSVTWVPEIGKKNVMTAKAKAS